MKYYLITLIVGLSLTGLRAQEKSLAKVLYHFKHVNDSSQRDKFTSDEVVTYLGTNQSYYSSYSKARLQEQLSEQMHSPSFDGNITLTGNSTSIKEAFYVDRSKQTLQKNTQLFTDEFLLPDTFPVLNWVMGDSVKNIGGYSCQDASTTFKGRTYKAWFTTELPFPFGPWKLQGLPGLILSASDLTGEVQFVYAGFDKNDSEKSVDLSPSEDALPVSIEAFEKLQKAFQDNREAYIQAAQARNSTKTKKSSAIADPALDPSRIKSMTVNKSETYKSSKTTNNPLELTP